jgi:hypothetical protein
VGGVVPVLGLVAISAYCLAVGTDRVVVVAPGGLLANHHANSLGELAEPGNIVDVGADGDAGTIASLVTVLVVWTFRLAQIGHVLAKEPGGRWAADDADRPICRGVSVEGSVDRCRCIGVKVALGDATPGDVVSERDVAGVEGAGGLAGPGDVLAEVQVGDGGAVESYDASFAEDVGVGGLE